jgi:DNA modification methylase
MSEEFLNGRVILHCGDCLDVLKTIPENTIDSACTDPPYHLTSIVKRFGAENAAPAQFGSDGRYARASAGFMGRKWDGGDIAFDPDTWRAVYRVLKPGAHLLACGGTRTFDMLGAAIRAAGFEIRDTIMWLYGSGFPKSHSIEKAIEREWECKFKSDAANNAISYLNPNGDQHEMDGVDSVPVLVWDLINDEATSDSVRIVDATSIWRQRISIAAMARFAVWTAKQNGSAISSATLTIIGKADASFDQMDISPSELAMENIDSNMISSWRKALGDGFGPMSMCTIATELNQITGLKIWNCLLYLNTLDYMRSCGSALKPAAEMIVLARRPLSEGTVAANVLKWGTGAINVDGCRIHADDAQGGNYTVTRLKPGATLNKTGGNWRPEDSGVEYHGEMKPGRWPANLIHDGSEEVVAAFPDVHRQDPATRARKTDSESKNAFHGLNEFSKEAGNGGGYDDSSASAARFFYTAKADSDDRLGSRHPTVKPLDLMQYLVRLITPPRGTCIDPFAGSGTTGEAAFREGMHAVLIEREEEYCADIRRRMALALSGPDERRFQAMKERLNGKPMDAGPLFGGQDLDERPLGRAIYGEYADENGKRRAERIATFELEVEPEPLLPESKRDDGPLFDWIRP